MKKWKMNKNRRSSYAAGVTIFAVLAGTLAGCSSVKAETNLIVQEQNQQEKSMDESSKTNSSEGENPVIENGNIVVGDIGISCDSDDEYTVWDENSAVVIELNDSQITINGQGAKAEGSTVTIEKGGTYILRGTLSDGTILVDAGDHDKVRLVFDGVNIHSETSAAVDIKKAEKTIISLEEGSVNSLSDSPNLIYRSQDKEEPNGALFSKGDLTINGSGKLTVNGTFNNAICSKDTLKIAGGNIEITAANHGIKGNDALVIYDGQLTIQSAGDGLKSDILTAVLGGTIQISDCEEGLEAETVIICGGTLDLTARDDGINASTDGNNTPQLYFMGGTVTVRAEGDGIDSNGSIHMSGGQLTVYGPSRRDNGALDYDREFDLTGGILAAFGAGGMDQNVSSTDSQISVLVDFQEIQQAGTVITLLDKEGNELYKGTGERDFQTAVISVPEMTAGNEYTIKAGEITISFIPEETIIYVNKEGIQERAAMGAGHGGFGNRNNRMDGRRERQPGERPEPPEGRNNEKRPKE